MLLDFHKEFAGVTAGNHKSFMYGRKLAMGIVRQVKMHINHRAYDLGNMSYQS